MTARGRHYQIALCMRLGAPLTDLVRDVGDEVKCDGCKERAHDAFGFHPSVCKAGNRGSLWTDDTQRRARARARRRALGEAAGRAAHRRRRGLVRRSAARAPTSAPTSSRSTS
jgi:hypothetical protein